MTGRAIAIGDVLDGKYRITAELGEGAMGVVYSAQHLSLGKPVAVKTLQSDFLESPEAAARFQIEARAASAIGHPHIIEVYDLGRSKDGSYYMVMEKLKGQPLSDLITTQGQIAIRDGVKIMIQVLAALGAAHKRGIVHRDLKPENIFLCATDDDPSFVKLLDFGISKVLRPGELAGPEERTLVTRTQAGVVMGTPLYMSPEQARGATDIDQKTDLWAAGAVLYELLCGRTPFDGDNYNQVLFAIMDGTFPRPSELAPHVTGNLEAIILRALTEERGQRFQTATEMRDALLTYQENPFADMALTLAPAGTVADAVSPGPRTDELAAGPRTDALTVAGQEAALSEGALSALDTASLMTLDGNDVSEARSAVAAVAPDAAFESAYQPPVDDDKPLELAIPRTVRRAPPPTTEKSGSWGVLVLLLAVAAGAVFAAWQFL